MSRKILHDFQKLDFSLKEVLPAKIIRMLETFSCQFNLQLPKNSSGDIFASLSSNLYSLPGAPVLLVLISAYLYWMFGPSSLIGVVVMILFLPLQVSAPCNQVSSQEQLLQFEFPSWFLIHLLLRASVYCTLKKDIKIAPYQFRQYIQQWNEQSSR